MIMGVIRRTHMCRRPRISIPLALKTEHGVAVAEIVCMDERRRKKRKQSTRDLALWSFALVCLDFARRLYESARSRWLSFVSPYWPVRWPAVCSTKQALFY